MWPSGQYSWSDENPFGPLGDGEVAGDKAFRTVLSKRRKHSDTDQVDSYSAFMVRQWMVNLIAFLMSYR